MLEAVAAAEVTSEQDEQATEEKAEEDEGYGYGYDGCRSSRGWWNDIGGKCC